MEMKTAKVVINKTSYLGFTILEANKIEVHDF